MEYIEVDSHREGVQAWIERGMEYATPTTDQRERSLGVELLAELFAQCQGRGLIQGGGGSSDTGKETLVVAGSIDLIGLARRALTWVAREATQ